MNRSVISIHPSKCSGGCPNENVCYLKKRVTTNTNSIKLKSYLGLTLYTHDIYLSVCSQKQVNEALTLVRCFKRVNLTIPFTLLDNFKHLLQSPIRNRLQISVYSEDNIKVIGNEVQKLYLIKDQETLEFTKTVFKDEYISNIHFPIDQNFITKDETLKLLKLWRDCKDPTITLDSCLENYAVHGKCLYQENYVDISLDGVYRKCVFDLVGKKIQDVNGIDQSIKKLIKKSEPVYCKYHTIFGGNNER